MNVMNSLWQDNFMDYVPPKEKFSNLLNPLMNNLSSIDYQNKDWTHDHDGLISKFS